MKKLIRFLKDEEGVTAVEYGLIAAATACAIVIALGTIGIQLEAVFDEIADALTENPSGGGGE